MPRTIVFGDVHGCIDELVDLFERLAPDAADRLVSVGDLVHKGPDDGAVVRWCREHRVDLVLGNHELMQARFRKALARVGDVSRVPVRDEAARAERAKTEAGLAPADVAYLEGGRLFARVPGGKVVHGGVLPRTRDLHHPADLASMSSKQRGSYELVTRVRMVRPNGSFVVLGEERPGDRYWADVYDGRFGHLWFGHQPWEDGRPRRFPHATGLDTGCVHGGALTAAVMEDGEVELVSVPARRVYAPSWSGSVG